MVYLICILVGLTQGLTEFLPVSSSGHLVLAQHILDFKRESLVLESVLHMGTACSIVLVFRHEIMDLVRNFFQGDTEKKSASRQFFLLILIASLPAAILGIFCKDFFEMVFKNPEITAVMLMVTGGILFATSRFRQTTGMITWPKALFIGVFQAFAILPGISRSGSTIAAALMMGVSRQESGRFSFLLALPAILGAMLLQAGDLKETGIPPAALATGFLVSFTSGVIALKLLLHFVRNGKLFYFGFYCVAVGSVSLFLI